MRWFFVRTDFYLRYGRHFHSHRAIIIPFSSYHYSYSHLVESRRKKNVLPFAVIFGVLFFIRKVILMMEVTIIAIIFIRSEQLCTIFFFFTPTEITWANQLDNSKYDKIWNIWWKSQTKCSQTRMLQDSNQIPRIVHCFFSFFCRLFVQRTLLFNTYMCSNHDMLHAQFRTDLHFRTLDLILNFFLFCVTCSILPHIISYFFPRFVFFRLDQRKTHIHRRKKSARLYVTVNKLGIENSII